MLAIFAWGIGPIHKEEALWISFTLIILLMLTVMVVFYVSKNKQVKALQKINDIAEEANRLKTAFIANMTHEIRTPLNAIVGFTTMLAEMDGLDKETRMSFLKEINDNKESLLRIVNDLLDYSKIEANTFDYPLAELN